jgi:hypothetical protein
MRLQRLSRSLSARGVKLTRYAMPRFEFVEELAGRTSLTLPGVFQTLPDAFLDVGSCGTVEEALPRGIWHSRGCLPFDRASSKRNVFSMVFHEFLKSATGKL